MFESKTGPTQDAPPLKDRLLRIPHMGEVPIESNSALINRALNRIDAVKLFSFPHLMETN